MKYKMKTNRNIEFTINQEGFNPANYIEDLNKDTVIMLAIGEILTQKHNIQSIYPVREEGDEEPEGIRLEVMTNQMVENENGEHSNEVLIAYVDEYKAGEISGFFNNARQSFVLIGDIIINKRNANFIIPAASEETE